MQQQQQQQQQQGIKITIASICMQFCCCWLQLQECNLSLGMAILTLLPRRSRIFFVRVRNLGCCDMTWSEISLDSDMELLLRINVLCGRPGRPMRGNVVIVGDISLW